MLASIDKFMSILIKFAFLAIIFGPFVAWFIAASIR